MDAAPLRDRRHDRPRRDRRGAGADGHRRLDDGAPLQAHPRRVRRAARCRSRTGRDRRRPRQLPHRPLPRRGHRARAGRPSPVDRRGRHGGRDRRCAARAVGPETAVVVLSHVAYRSGYLADAADLTRIAHDAGAHDPLGSVPLRRLGAGRGRRVGLRPRRRLHVQVPQRRPRVAGVRLRRCAAPGHARAADPGMDGHRGRLRDGAGVPSGRGDAPVPLGHPADRRDARDAGHARDDRGCRHRRDPHEVGRPHRVRRADLGRRPRSPRRHASHRLATRRSAADTSRSRIRRCGR